jgi:hypothetical protein
MILGIPIVPASRGNRGENCFDPHHVKRTFFQIHPKPLIHNNINFHAK